MRIVDENTILEYVVTTMSCNSCRSLIIEELGELDGVTDVAVDLASGRVSVTGIGLRDEPVRSQLAAVGHAPQ